MPRENRCVWYLLGLLVYTHLCFVQANKIGQLVLSHADEMMKGGASEQQPAATAIPDSYTSPESTMSIASKSITADSRTNLPRVQAVQMQLYQFAADLPADCELRVCLYHIPRSHIRREYILLNSCSV